MRQPKAKAARVTALYGFTSGGRTELIPEESSYRTKATAPSASAVFRTDLPPEVEEKLPPTEGSAT